MGNPNAYELVSHMLKSDTRPVRRLPDVVTDLCTLGISLRSLNTHNSYFAAYQAYGLAYLVSARNSKVARICVHIRKRGAILGETRSIRNDAIIARVIRPLQHRQYVLYTEFSWVFHIYILSTSMMFRTVAGLSITYTDRKTA